MPELKLYLAHSILEEFKGHPDVKLLWFFYDRQVPVAPYEKLIEDYNGCWRTRLEHKRQERERCVNQFLTDHEIRAMGLRSFHSGCWIQMSARIASPRKTGRERRCGNIASTTEHS